MADELVVVYKSEATPPQRAEARNRAGARLRENVVKGHSRKRPVELVRLEAGSDRGEAERRIEQDPAVSYAEPNWLYTRATTSNDPYYTNGSLWGAYGDATSPANQYGSQAGKAWAGGNAGNNSVYVGVIDEGIQHTHPDLDGQVWTNPFDVADGVDNDRNGYIDDLNGWDFEGNNNTIYDGGTTGDVDDHGTHVSGTIGAKANNGIGLAGVSPNVTLISAKFLGSQGGTLANAVKAVDYFTDLKTRHGLNIVATNNSWGGGGYSTALLEAIKRANNAGILFIAAAGNSGTNNDLLASYPSSYNVDNVIAVAAIDKAGALASFSQYGALTVDLGAPGVGIVSTTAHNGYSSYGGTSMATPHVTGAAALYKAVNPEASAATIKSAILSSVVPTASLSGKTVTGGRLNASSFVATSAVSSAPQSLTATGNVGSIALSWSAPASDGGSAVTGYNVYRGGTLVGSTDALSFSDPVEAGTEYSYFVRAVNAGGESVDSNTAKATAKATPSAPQALTAVGNVNSIALSWSAPASDGGSAVTGYNVYRGGTLVGSTGTPSFSDAVPAGTEYSYFVRAVNAVGESVDSNIAKATAKAQVVARAVTLKKGTKRNNYTPITVNWVGFSGVKVRITRSGSTFSTDNDGHFAETRRGTGTITYKVCESASSTACVSASITI